MVKPPQYEEMDSARENEIPRAFQDVCGDNKTYVLETHKPKKSERHMPDGNTSCWYTVKNKKTRQQAAEFLPNGFSDCKDDGFKQFFDEIVQRVDAAAQQAYQEYKEFEQRHRAQKM